MSTITNIWVWGPQAPAIPRLWSRFFNFGKFWILSVRPIFSTFYPVQTPLTGEAHVGTCVGKTCWDFGRDPTQNVVEALLYTQVYTCTVQCLICGSNSQTTKPQYTNIFVNPVYPGANFQLHSCINGNGFIHKISGYFSGSKYFSILSKFSHTRTNWGKFSFRFFRVRIKIQSSRPHFWTLFSNLAILKFFFWVTKLNSIAG